MIKEGVKSKEVVVIIMTEKKTIVSLIQYNLKKIQPSWRQLKPLQNE